MRQENRSPVTFMTMGIAGFFLAGFFLLVVFGAQTYRGIVQGQTENNHTRELLGYLATCARANDSEGALQIGTYGDGSMLVIADGTSGYAFRIYRYEGSLVEDYGPMDSEVNPETAMVIGETDIFWIEERQEGVFVVTTDAGTVLFHTRSGV